MHRRIWSLASIAICCVIQNQDPAIAESAVWAENVTTRILTHSSRKFTSLKSGDITGRCFGKTTGTEASQCARKACDFIRNHPNRDSQMTGDVCRFRGKTSGGGYCAIAKGRMDVESGNCGKTPEATIALAIHECDLQYAFHFNEEGDSKRSCCAIVDFWSDFPKTANSKNCHSWKAIDPGWCVNVDAAIPKKYLPFYVCR